MLFPPEIFQARKLSALSILASAMASRLVMSISFIFKRMASISWKYFLLQSWDEIRDVSHRSIEMRACLLDAWLLSRRWNLYVDVTILLSANCSLSFILALCKYACYRDVRYRYFIGTQAVAAFIMTASRRSFHQGSDTSSMHIAYISSVTLIGGKSTISFL